MSDFQERLRRVLREHVEVCEETALQRTPVTEAEYCAMEETFGLRPADHAGTESERHSTLVRTAGLARGWFRAIFLGVTAAGAFWLGTLLPRERGEIQFAAATMRGAGEAAATPGSPESAALLQKDWKLSLDLDAGRFAIRFADGSTLNGPIEIQPGEPGELRIGVHGTGRTRAGKPLRLTGGEVLFRYSAANPKPQRSGILILGVSDEAPIEQVYGAPAPR